MADDEARRWRRHIVRTWLEHINVVALQLADHKRRLAEIRSIAEPRGIDYSAVRVSTSPSADAIPNAVARIDELEARYVTDIAGLDDELRDARIRMLCLTATQIRVIDARYMRGNSRRPTVKETAAKLDYSADWVSRNELDALDALFHELPGDWRVKVPSAV